MQYIGLIGTSASEIAVNLNCSKPMPCTNITLESINLRPANKQVKEHISSSCNNAFGSAIGTVEPSSCL